MQFFPKALGALVHKDRIPLLEVCLESNNSSVFVCHESMVNYVLEVNDSFVCLLLFSIYANDD